MGAVNCSGTIQNVNNVIAARKEPAAVMPELEGVPVKRNTLEKTVMNAQKTTGIIQIAKNATAVKVEQVAVHKRLETVLVARLL